MAVSQRRQREREARRRSILDAAEQVISERGLWATTMEDVAREAELSKGTLYLYFDNRDALCAALAERSIRCQLDDLEQAMEGAESGLGRLRAVLEFYRELFGARPHLFRMAISWMIAGVQCSPDDPDFLEYRKRLARVMGLVIDAIERGQRDGSIRPELDPRLLAAQLWAGLLGTFLLQFNREDMFQRLPFRVDADALAPLYVEHMMRAIQGEGEETS